MMSLTGAEPAAEEWSFRQTPPCLPHTIPVGVHDTPPPPHPLLFLILSSSRVVGWGRTKRHEVMRLTHSCGCTRMPPATLLRSVSGLLENKKHEVNKILFGFWLLAPQTRNMSLTRLVCFFRCSCPVRGWGGGKQET